MYGLVYIILIQITCLNQGIEEMLFIYKTKYWVTIFYLFVLKANLISLPFVLLSLCLRYREF